jgi:hypothetical protein
MIAQVVCFRQSRPKVESKHPNADTRFFLNRKSELLHRQEAAATGYSELDGRDFLDVQLLSALRRVP